MKWLFRPSVLVILSLSLVAGAVAVWVRFRPDASGPTPLPVGPGDREIVWLASATSAASWERFVAALKLTEDRLKSEVPGLRADIDPAKAFPQQSTVVPEATLTWDGAGGKLLFRWYKVTSDRKVRDWVKVLLKDRPAPLAIIGGSNSDNARDLVLQLRAATDEGDTNRPLLYLTTATADKVPLPQRKEGEPDPVPRRQQLDIETDAAGEKTLLNSLYPGRTFRFCFSNQQMSRALTDFIWSRADLRPEGPPVHLVRWMDDTYSGDLVQGFANALIEHPATQNFNQEVDSSVGTFDAANRYEALQVGFLIRQMAISEPYKRTPLVLAGQVLPSRRFLRELARTDRTELFRRLNIVTGDAISFNTVYRDRLVTWHIKDLPFPLLFFSHADPINADAGFKPYEGGAPARTLGDTGASGTEDILLYSEILSTLVHIEDRAALSDAERLRERLLRARYHAGRISFGTQGPEFFQRDGDRAKDTGEHIVWLQPSFDESGRIRSRATITVFTGRGGPKDRAWEPVGPVLEVSYEPPTATGEDPR